MKIQETKNGQIFVCLPRNLVRAKGWDKGDELEPIFNKQGDLVLKKREKGLFDPLTRRPSS